MCARSNHSNSQNFSHFFYNWNLRFLPFSTTERDQFPFYFPPFTIKPFGTPFELMPDPFWTSHKKNLLNFNDSLANGNFEIFPLSNFRCPMAKPHASLSINAWVNSWCSYPLSVVNKILQHCQLKITYLCILQKLFGEIIHLLKKRIFIHHII